MRVFSVRCDAVVISPNMRQTSRKQIPCAAKLNGLSGPSQITLYFRLLLIAASRLVVAGCSALTERQFKPANKVRSLQWRHQSAGLVGLTPQERRDVEQIFLFAKARPVVRIQRGQPGLGNLLCRLGSWTRCRFRRRGACAAHSGYPLDEAGHSPLRS
jgi:hypothetical protein